MELRKFGVFQDYRELFTLGPDNEFGYKMTCIDAAGKVTFNNVQSITWAMGGKEVSLVPPLIDGRSFNFTRFAEVEINKASTKATLPIKVTYHTPDQLRSFKRKYAINIEPNVIHKYVRI